MDKTEIQSIIEKQKLFFESGRTLDINYRLDVLKRLKALIIKHEKDVFEALRADFNKPEFETYSSDNHHQRQNQSGTYFTIAQKQQREIYFHLDDIGRPTQTVQKR